MTDTTLTTPTTPFSTPLASVDAVIATMKILLMPLTGEQEQRTAQAWAEASPAFIRQVELRVQFAQLVASATIARELEMLIGMFMARSQANPEGAILDAIRGVGEQSTAGSTAVLEALVAIMTGIGEATETFGGGTAPGPATDASSPPPPKPDPAPTPTPTPGRARKGKAKTEEAP